MNKVEIDKLLWRWRSEYLNTLTDSYKTDWYESPQGFATVEVTRFIRWVKNNKIGNDWTMSNE